MNCPACRNKLYKKDINLGSDTPASINVCYNCGGMWLMYSEISKIMKLKIFPETSIPIIELQNGISLIEEGTRECPICSSVLNVMQRHGVNVDTCEQCKAVWFDGGELKRIFELSHAPDAGRFDNPGYLGVDSWNSLETPRRSVRRTSDAIDFGAFFLDFLADLIFDGRR